jgi:hypothetical protein
VDVERIDDEALRAVLHGLDLEVGSPRLVGATPNLWADELMTSV